EISTGTPVALLNASISLTNASSSAWTKYFQRSIESLAPFSGFQGAFCAQAFDHSRKAGPLSAAAAPAAVPPLTTARRVKSFILVPPFGFSLIQSFSSRLVEQMHQRRIRLEPDLVA